MQQPPHLPPNPGQYPPVGLPHLAAPKLPLPQGLSGLPVALGGTANVTRPNGLHPSMMLPTPPPLVSVPHTSVPPGANGPLLVVPPHRAPLPPHTAAPLAPPPPMAPNSRPGLHPPGNGLPPNRSAPATLDTSTRPTHSATTHPTPSTDNSNTNSISQGLTRPRSPADRQTESPSAKRARSRSPLQVADDSDSDSEPPRSPEPDATILDRECHRSKNAIFLRHLSRGWNSCSRCDIQFRPTSDSAASRSREVKEKEKAISQQQQQEHQSSVKEPPMREERRDRREDEPKPAMNGGSSPPTSSSKPADPPGFLPPVSAAHLASHYGRLSPGRPHYPPLGVQDPTPALRQLSEYARPHVLGEPPRSLPYSVGSIPNPLMAADPYYRMAAMYPPGSRERLELELDREKRERDARERELREKELRDMELREKMKQEMEMKQPAAGFERILPPGANPMDPYWTELLKRYAAIPPAGAHAGNPGGQPGVSGPVAHHPSQLPGIYSPAHLNSDLIRAERERMERIGEAARAAGNDPLRNANLAFYEYYQRVSYEQIVLHRQALAQATGSKSPDPAAGGDPRLAEYARLAQHFARADPLSGSSGVGGQPPPTLPGYAPVPPAHSLPPGHPLLEAARQQELLYRDLLSRSPYGAAAADPVLAQHLQLSAQQEAARIALERERLAAHGAGSRPPSHLH